MPNAFTNQLLHVVWSTAKSEILIPEPYRSEINQYITGIVRSQHSKLLEINGAYDHFHMLIKLHPDIALSKLMNLIKSNTSRWINDADLLKLSNPFQWQEGFSAFGLHEERIEPSKKYLSKELSRHQTQSYMDELSWMLEQQQINFHPHFFPERSHSKIYLHTIWSTKYREKELKIHIRKRLFKFFETYLAAKKCRLIQAGGVEDHIHVLIEMARHISTSDMMMQMKKESSIMIGGTFPEMRGFQWQTGYGAFTVGMSILDQVKQYVANQEEHHRYKSKSDEWSEMVSKFGGCQA